MVAGYGHCGRGLANRARGMGANVVIFTFEEDGFYVNDISGLDAAEREKVEVANHNFRAGIYRIDATTTLNTSMEGTTWYNKTETTTRPP